MRLVIDVGDGHEIAIKNDAAGLYICTSSTTSVPADASPPLAGAEASPGEAPGAAIESPQARNTRARLLTNDVLGDGGWHDKRELNAAWREAGLEPDDVSRLFGRHVEKRKFGKRWQWRLKQPERPHRLGVLGQPNGSALAVPNGAYE